MKTVFPFCLFILVLFFTTVESAFAQTQGDAKRGQDLFVGNIRFTNNGPTCNSCHNVSVKGFISGGALAKDLTQAVSRLTADGAKAFFGSSPMPMPQMQQSYTGRPLTPEEINDLLAFLIHSDDLAKTSQPESTIGKKMLTGGIIGVVGLLILFSFFWIKRKQRSVNYSIYERQIKST